MSGSSAAHRSTKRRKMNWGRAKKPSKWTHNVEQILAKRYADGRPQLLLKWVGYPLQQSTWEPIENLSGDCLSMLADFEAAEFAKLNAQNRGSTRQQGAVDSSLLKQKMEYGKTQKTKQKKKQKKLSPKKKLDPMNQLNLSSDLCNDLMMSSDSSDNKSSGGNSSSSNSSSDSDSDAASKRQKLNTKSSDLFKDLKLPPNPNLSSDGDSDDNGTSLPRPVASAAPKLLPMAPVIPIPSQPVAPNMPLAPPKRRPRASSKTRIRPVSMPLLTNPALAPCKPPMSSIATPARAPPASLEPAAPNLPRSSLKPPLSQFEPLDLSQSEQPTHKRSSNRKEDDNVKNPKLESRSTASFDAQDLSKSSFDMREKNNPSTLSGSLDEDSSKRKKKSQSQSNSSKQSHPDAQPLTMDATPNNSSKSDESNIILEHVKGMPIRDHMSEAPAKTEGPAGGMGRWDDALNIQTRIQGLQRGLPLEKIVKVFKMRKEVYMMVKWKTVSSLDAVPINALSELYPHVVLEFFEQLDFCSDSE